MNNTNQPDSYEYQVNQINQKTYGGIRRLPFVFIMIGLFAVDFFMKVKTPDFFPNDLVFIMYGIVNKIVHLFLIAYRLKNTGMNPWFCLLMFIPFVNIYIGIRCLAFPEGYSDMKKLDVPGTIVEILILIILILILVIEISPLL